MKLSNFLIVLFVLFIIVYWDKKSDEEAEEFLKENFENNNIKNNSQSSQAEKLSQFCLEEMGLKGIDLTIESISEKEKKKYEKNGETINAHLRDYDGRYVLYINEDLENNLEEIISHEMIHLSQYNSGRLSYQNGIIIWLGEKYVVDDINYYERPWEMEAFRKESVVARKVKKRMKY